MFLFHLQTQFSDQNSAWIHVNFHFLPQRWPNIEIKSYFSTNLRQSKHHFGQKLAFGDKTKKYFIPDIHPRSLRNDFQWPFSVEQHCKRLLPKFDYNLWSVSEFFSLSSSSSSLSFFCYWFVLNLINVFIVALNSYRFAS